jgi:hypothetical protein
LTNATEVYGHCDCAYTSYDDTPVDVNSPLVDPTLPRAIDKTARFALDNWPDGDPMSLMY